MNAHPIKLGGVHHAAYRCKDAKETVEWYGRVLGMDYTTAFAEDHVPSTGAYDPYMHVFLDAGNGNVLAFFELPHQKDMGRDENTPAWVQHLAFKVGSEAELLAAKAHVEAQGIEVEQEFWHESQPVLLEPTEELQVPLAFLAVVHGPVEFIEIIPVIPIVVGHPIPLQVIT